MTTPAPIKDPDFAGSREVPAAPTSHPDWPWLLRAETVDGLIVARAALTPDDLFLVDEAGQRVTFGEFDARVTRVAAALAAAGVTVGTRVAWQLPTRISTLLVMAALRRLGAVQAPIIPLYREREVSAALATTDAQVLLVPGTWRGFDFAAMAARIAAAGGPAPRVVEIGYDAPEAEPVGEVAEPAPDPDAVRWIYFTSGSTGVPKGARHTDSTLLCTGLAFAGIGELGRRPGEFGSIGYPVAHVGGIEYLIAALAGGMSLLLLEAFVPDRAVELYNRYGVTTTGGAPPFYSALLAAAGLPAGQRLVPTLRTLKGGGAPCPPHLVPAVAERLGAVLAHDYGMTEVPMIAVASPSDPPDVLAETDGRPVPGNRIRLMDPADPDGTRNPASAGSPPGGVGEVQVSGAGVCRGYTDPAATAEAFTADGWFRTGDLGRLLPSGHIEVVGRLKEMIIRKGENVAPQEIEGLLGQHPALAEVAVLGLPDPERGERVCAVVAPRPGHAAPTLAELTAWLSEAGLMRQKLPEQLEIVDALPRTGLGKIAKNQLRERLAASIG
ncbi:MAG: AMP-binding protein [Frankia sp.]|nr:AMP-binding protein [Frankia sp.]